MQRVLVGHGLSGSPQGLSDDEAAKDATPRIVGTFADPNIGPMGLNIEDRGHVCCGLVMACRQILLLTHGSEATVATVTITSTDFEVFCRRSFGGVLSVVDRLGDELINEQPPLTGGASPFALVTHIVGACEWWVGHMVVGDPSERVRHDEFTATGTVSQLHVLVEHWLELLSRRRGAIETATSLHAIPQTQTPLDGQWTVGAALIHAYEELAQHLGHLEVTADLLLASE